MLPQTNLDGVNPCEDDDVAMARAPGKLVVVLSGGAILCLAAAAALRWHDIAAGYHLYLLERDPGYFLEASAAAEGSPRREAAERFIAREGSFERVLQALEERKKGAQQPSGPPASARGTSRTDKSGFNKPEKNT